MSKSRRLSVLNVLALCGVATVSGQASAQCVTPKWVQLFPLNNPLPRYAPAFAFDSNAGVAVMYGGIPSTPGATVLNDTWVWDGTDWSGGLTPSIPPLRNAAMGFSQGFNQVVMHGGIDNTGAIRSQAYSFNPTTFTWTAFTTLNTTLSGGRFNHTLTNAGPSMVLTGGIIQNCSSAIFGRFLRLSNNWLSPATTLDTSYGIQTHGTFYRTANDSLYIVGGAQINTDCNPAANQATQQIVQVTNINNINQSSIVTQTPFSARNNIGLADNFNSDFVAVFGGSTQNNFPSATSLLNETWIRSSNGTWTQLQGPGPSPRRAFNAMVYDSVRNQFVLFGGHNGSSMGDTWVLTYAPVFTAQPRLLNADFANPGSTIQLSGTADGPGTLGYSWYRNGVLLSDAGPNPSGSIYTGIFSDTLTIANIGPFDDADYRLDVFNSCGTTRSKTFRLRVCYANCDGSNINPILGANDFSCFLNKFRAGDSYANCDGSTTPPVLGPADFSCFLNKFRAGC